MKYLLIGDIHSTNLLKDLDKIISFEKPENIISTGDLDSVETIRNYIDFEKKHKKEGINVITVSGNHEHAIFYNNIDLVSENLKEIGKTSEEIHQELIKDPIAYTYIKDMLNRKENIKGKKFFIDEKKYTNIYPALAMHGALKGNISSYPECPGEIKYLWNRLETEQDYRNNFNQMKRENVKVLIRGHDHNNKYVYQDNNKIKINNGQYGEIYLLRTNRLHVINPGSLSEGNFAIIDTDITIEPILKYSHL